MSREELYVPQLSSTWRLRNREMHAWMSKMPQWGDLSGCYFEFMISLGPNSFLTLLHDWTSPLFSRARLAVTLFEVIFLMFSSDGQISIMSRYWTWMFCICVAESHAKIPSFVGWEIGNPPTFYTFIHVRHSLLTKSPHGAPPSAHIRNSASGTGTKRWIRVVGFRWSCSCFRWMKCVIAKFSKHERALWASSPFPRLFYNS